MLSLQIAGGLLMAAFIVMMATKGMAVHRAETGVKGTFGALLFLLAVVIGGAVVIAATLSDVPY